MLKLTGLSLHRRRIKGKGTSLSFACAQLHGGAGPIPAKDATELIGGESPALDSDFKRQRLALLQWPKTRFLEQRAIVENMGSPKIFQSMYELFGQVGKGRYGIVFAGRHAKSGSVVAIKVADDADASAEPWLLAHCHHPNIVRVFDFFASPFCTMMAMENGSAMLIFSARPFK